MEDKYKPTAMQNILMMFLAVPCTVLDGYAMLKIYEWFFLAIEPTLRFFSGVSLGSAFLIFLSGVYAQKFSVSERIGKSVFAPLMFLFFGMLINWIL